MTSLCQKAVRREVSQVWTLGKLHALLGSGGTRSGLLCSYGDQEEHEKTYEEHEVLLWVTCVMGKARQDFVEKST